MWQQLCDWVYRQFWLLGLYIKHQYDIHAKIDREIMRIRRNLLSRYAEMYRKYFADKYLYVATTVEQPLATLMQALTTTFIKAVDLGNEKIKDDYGHFYMFHLIFSEQGFYLCDPITVGNDTIPN